MLKLFRLMIVSGTIILMGELVVDDRWDRNLIGGNDQLNIRYLGKVVGLYKYNYRFLQEFKYI